VDWRNARTALCAFTYWCLLYISQTSTIDGALAGLSMPVVFYSPAPLCYDTDYDYFMQIYAWLLNCKSVYNYYCKWDDDGRLTGLLGTIAGNSNSESTNHTMYCSAWQLGGCVRCDLFAQNVVDDVFMKPII
jgi:hypothetical protein